MAQLTAQVELPSKPPSKSKIEWGAKIIILLAAIQDPFTQSLLLGLSKDFNVSVPEGMFSRIMALLGIFIWVSRRFFTNAIISKPNLKDPWS
ncbi:MAG: hypothetical protein HPY84_02790 [Syntrophobacteraceae bacterium]|nr:hypothetical protein [Syntrophobacteraceae bacterium]